MLHSESQATVDDPPQQEFASLVVRSFHRGLAALRSACPRSRQTTPGRLRLLECRERRAASTGSGWRGDGNDPEVPFLIGAAEFDGAAAADLQPMIGRVAHGFLPADWDNLLPNSGGAEFDEALDAPVMDRCRIGGRHQRHRVALNRLPSQP